MRILIGYDGSESADAIFDDLKRAGLPRDSKVQVVSVADLLMTNPPAKEVAAQILTSRRVAAALRQTKMHIERVIKETEEFVLKASDRLRSEFPEWDITGKVRTGTPAWELLDAANDWNADLVVVGSQGRSAIGRFFLGSVSKKLATNALCSVRVVRSDAPKDMSTPPRIIVAVDGSLTSEEAIYVVGQRVWQNGTQVRLVAVDDGTSPATIATRLPQAAKMINGYLKNRKSRVRLMLDWATKELNSIGLETSVFMEKGDPKNILLEEARKWNADSIFVGTRDFKSTFERFRLGSVSTAVVTNAHCSVEIVRPTDKGQD